MNDSNNKRFNDDGSRNAYVYSDSQVHKIFDEVEIQDEINIPMFLIVNIALFTLIVVLVNSFDLSILGGILVTVPCLAVIYFYYICFMLLIKKMGHPWWTALVPIYNIYLFLKLAFKKPIQSLIPYIILYGGMAAIIWYLPNTPYAEYIQYVKYAYYASFALLPINYFYKLGSNFNQSGILMVILGIILIPITAFSSKYDYIGSEHFF